MRLEFTEEEQAFREEVRAFLREKLPAQIRDKVLNGYELSREDHVHVAAHACTSGAGAAWAGPSSSAARAGIPCSNTSSRRSRRRRARRG